MKHNYAYHIFGKKLRRRFFTEARLQSLYRSRRKDERGIREHNLRGRDGDGSIISPNSRPYSRPVSSMSIWFWTPLRANTTIHLSFFFTRTQFCDIQAECSRYFGRHLLRPVAYAGSAKARRRLAHRLGLGGGVTDDSSSKNGVGCGGPLGSSGAAPDGRGERDAEAAQEPESANVVITSYNVLRTDSGVLGEQVGSVFGMDGELGLFPYSCAPGEFGLGRRTRPEHHGGKKAEDRYQGVEANHTLRARGAMLRGRERLTSHHVNSHHTPYRTISRPA